jgi:hypothetical protein
MGTCRGPGIVVIVLMFTTEGVAVLTSLENEPGKASGSGLAMAQVTESRIRSINAKTPTPIDPRDIMPKQKVFLFT